MNEEPARLRVWNIVSAPTVALVTMYSLRPTIGLTCLAASACGAIAAPDAPDFDRPDVREWVTPSLAAASLDAEGHFVFPDPTPSPDVVLTAEDAAGLAAAYVRTFITNPNVITPPSIPGFGVTSLRQSIEWEHGAPVNWDRLRLAPWRPYFMESPVEPLPDSLPQALRNHLAPRWHVLFVSGANLVLDVAVASGAVDVAVTPSGWLTSVSPGGNALRSSGLPRSLGPSLPHVPERAVRSLVGTGARVAELPRLLGPWGHLSPHFARWVLRLDRSITVVADSTGESLSTDEVLVGQTQTAGGVPKLQWYVRAPNQPQGEAYPYPGPGRELRTVNLQFTPGFPIAVTPVR